MNAFRTIACATTIALAAGAVSPVSFAASKDSTPTKPPAITIKVDTFKGENACTFTDNEKLQIKEPKLDVRSSYKQLRRKLRTAIREQFPELAEDFRRADAITGIGSAPKPGSMNNVEFDAIFTKVQQAMVEREFNADETYLAFHHSPAGRTIERDFSDEKLVPLPVMNIDEARSYLRIPNSDPQSVIGRANTYFKASAALRQWLKDLTGNASLALLAILDKSAVDRTRRATKNVTVVLPDALGTDFRAAVTACVRRLNNINFRDGTASSDASSDPLRGSTSSQTNQQGNQSGDLSSGFEELSSGEGTSSITDVQTIFENGSSDDDAQKKISLLVSILGLAVFVANLGRQAGPLMQIWNEMVDESAREFAESRGQQ